MMILRAPFMSFVSAGVLAMAAGLDAQDSHLVVPAAYETSEASGSAFWALSPFQSRRQLLIASSELVGLVGRELTALSVRRNAGAGDEGEGGRVHVTMWVSHSSASPAEPSTRLADNRGKDPRMVFSGFVQLPDAPSSKSKPAAWSAPQSATLRFKRGFRYLGGTLLIETMTTVAGGRRTAWWPIDAAVGEETGVFRSFGSSCVRDMAGQPASVDAASAILGSTAVFSLRGARRNGHAFLAIGASAVRYGSLRLPLDLGRFGAPGCTLYTDLAMVLPSVRLTALPGAPFCQANARLRVPRLASLAGREVFAQWIVPDSRANAMGLGFSNAASIIVGAAPKRQTVAWIETEPGSTGGSVLLRRVPVLRFTHRK